MIHVLICILLVLLYLAIYQIWGQILCYVLKWKNNDILKVEFCGFFLYFGFFQMIALPLILLKRSLSMLSYIWVALNILIIALFVFLIVTKRCIIKVKQLEDTSLVTRLLMIVAFLIVIGQAYYGAVQFYTGWDTAYYLGTMNSAVYTNTMYQYDGSTGRIVSDINLRYALSTFFMNTAVVAKITGLHILTIQRYVVSSICVLMSNLIVYLIGKLIFSNDARKTSVLVILNVVFSYYLISEYSTSQFLLLRGYEAKGYCANVVIPATLYCMLRIWKRESKANWKLLFLVAFASVPISMSAILIVPVLIGLMLLAQVIIKKNWKELIYGFICVLPNILYLLLYFLYARGLLIIGV